MFAKKNALKNGKGVAFADKAYLSALPIRRTHNPLFQFDHNGAAVFGADSHDHSTARG